MKLWYELLIKMYIYNKPELVCKVLFECLYDKKTASFEHKELERTPFHSQLEVGPIDQRSSL